MSRRERTPLEASWLLCKNPRSDAQIPDDHHQIIALRQLLATGDRESRDYQTRHFAALMILFSQYTPERVGEACSKNVDCVLREKESA